MALQGCQWSIPCN